MTTRNSTAESFFHRANSTISEVDSDYQQFKEEFEKKEKEYRAKIHYLKKEVSEAKESLSKVGVDLNETRDRLNSKDTLYSQLDEETKQKVNLKDVKIALLKEHIDKAKAKQMELLKGPVKKINRECDALLNEILKAKQLYEKRDITNEANRSKLDRYYSI